MEPVADSAETQPTADCYVEGGRVVFTAAFLLRRGVCCGNGCRHCPYEGDAKRDPARADRRAG